MPCASQWDMTGIEAELDEVLASAASGPLSARAAAVATVETLDSSLAFVCSSLACESAPASLTCCTVHIMLSRRVCCLTPNRDIPPAMHIKFSSQTLSQRTALGFPSNLRLEAASREEAVRTANAFHSLLQVSCQMLRCHLESWPCLLAEILSMGCPTPRMRRNKMR